MTLLGIQVLIACHLAGGRVFIDEPVSAELNECLIVFTRDKLAFVKRSTRELSITNRGQAYVCSLLNVELPVMQWVTPKGVKP